MAGKSSFQSQLNHWSKEVRNRDGNKCVVCGAEKYLNAHHILSKKFFRKLALEPTNGISLCPRHHSFGGCSAHMNGVWFTEWLRVHRPDQYKWVLGKMAEMELMPPTT